MNEIKLTFENKVRPINTGNKNVTYGVTVPIHLAKNLELGIPQEFHIINPVWKEEVQNEKSRKRPTKKRNN